MKFWAYLVVLVFGGIFYILELEALVEVDLRKLWGWDTSREERLRT